MENENEIIEKTNKKSLMFTRILMLIVAIVPILLVAILYQKMPEKIPGHWEMDNIRYDPKWTSFITCLLPMLMFGLSFLATSEKFAPKNTNPSKIQRNIICDFFLAIELFLCSLQIIVLIETFKPNTVEVGKVVPFILGLLLIILGNFIPKMPVKSIKKTDNQGINIDSLNKQIKQKRVIGLLAVIFGIILAIISWVCSSIILIVVSICVFVLCVIIALIATRK